MKISAARISIYVGLTLSAVRGVAIAQDQIEEIVVVAPGGAATTEARRFPGNVQTATDSSLLDSGAINLSDFVNRGLGSVHLNDVQNNPFQPDLFYRGFGTSPLLGTPQGMAIYVDGVRRNELFGDVVNWDTIPESALSRIELIPGANPLFGLNALGGALAMQTKSGFTHPGNRGEILAGSFGRLDAHAETAGTEGATGWYLTVKGFTEDGWRDFSDSDLVQTFAKLSLQGEASNTDIDVTFTDSELRGNGSVPEELMKVEGRETVFTHPDITENELVQINARNTWFVNESATVSSGLYYRQTNTDTFNGDASEFGECEEFSGFTCEEESDDEELARDQFGNPIPFTDAVDGGIENSSGTSQDSIGASLQASMDRAYGGKTHQIVLGGTLDYGEADFKQRSELARLTADRGTVGSGFVVQDSITDVQTDTLHGSVFVADTIALNDRMDLTVSARFNHTNVEIRDRLPAQAPGGDDGETADTGDEDETRSLNGDHTFNRLNPAIAISYRTPNDATVYGSISQSNRAPTPAELTCANPDDPCRLPNAFVDDPPLDQVITRTLEVGARGRTDRGLRWSGALFFAESDDDILFVSAGATTSQGFFRNVGETRRQGIELGIQGETGRLRFGAFYTYVDAEFRTAFLTNSPNHPRRNPDDEDLPAPAALQVRPGNRIPGVPEHIFKLNLMYDVTDKLSLGGDLVAQSDQFFRGDESNTADTLDGFVVVHANATYRFTDKVDAFLRINNLFDSDYETFGVFGDAGEVLGDEFEDARRFVGPGGPIGAWLGLRVGL